MKDIQLKAERTDQQKLAWATLAMKSVRRLLYGGAKGGGKSWFLCIWLFCTVWSIMVKADLKPSKNPPHVAWFGRKQAVDLTGTTLQTWREVIPEEYYVLRGATEKDPKHILIAGRIAIDYGGLDKSENIQKFNSAEYMVIAIDQAEEVTKDEVAVLRASLRMVLKDKDGKPIKIPFKELYTANPRKCWLKNDFITNPKPNAKFVRALPSDNPHLPDDYIQTLEEAFEHRPELLDAYLRGLWNVFEGHDQVIKDSWLQELKNRRCDWAIVKHYLVCDPARFGDDTTVIFRMVNSEIAEKIIMPYCRTTEISGRMAALSNQYGGLTCVVESTGGDIGAGVIDELVDMGIDVITFCPNAACTKKVMTKTSDKGKTVMTPVFGNLRAEAWDKAAKILSSGILDKEHNMILVTKNMYQDLETQLCYPRYRFRGGKTLVESKDDLKKPDRLGKSPDDADCYIIALWAWDKIDAVVDDEEEIRYEPDVNRSPMRMC